MTLTTKTQQVVFISQPTKSGRTDFIHSQRFNSSSIQEPLSKSWILNLEIDTHEDLA